MGYKFIDLGPATADNYKNTRKNLERTYEVYKEKVDAIGEKLVNMKDFVELDNQKSMISQMIGECDYAIEWLETGRRPGNKRGIERQAAYQRERLMDPVRMQSFVSGSSAGSPANLTDWQRFQIEDALSRLSDRERECYVLAHGECFSFAEIAEFLNISKGSVETYVERAQKKISEDLQTSLFLVG